MKICLLYLVLLVSVVSCYYTYNDLPEVIKIEIQGKSRYFRKVKVLNESAIAIVFVAQEIESAENTDGNIGVPIVLKIENAVEEEDDFQLSKDEMENEILAYRFLIEKYEEVKQAGGEALKDFQEVSLANFLFSGTSQPFEANTNYVVLAIELLGDSLYEIFFNNRPDEMEANTLFGYILQMLKFTKLVNFYKLFHLDMKPDNFVECHRSKKISAVDFAYSRHPKSVKHIGLGPSTYSSPNIDTSGGIGDSVSALDDYYGFLCVTVEILAGWVSWDKEMFKKRKIVEGKDQFEKFVTENLKDFMKYKELPNLLIEAMKKLNGGAKGGACDYGLIKVLEEIIADRKSEMVPLPPMPV